MDFTTNWGWPQWTYLIMCIISLLISAGSHGKPREPHNGFVAFVAFGIATFLMIAGGFYQ